MMIILDDHYDEVDTITHIILGFPTRQVQGSN